MWEEQATEETQAEGGLQTVCMREEREYLSLSSWMTEGRGGGAEEEREINETDG